AASVPSQWAAQEVEDLLYLLARDYVWAEVAAKIQQNCVAALQLASQSLSLPAIEPASRSELAKILGHCSAEPQAEPLLLRFANDEAEYVRRMALQSLARLGSSSAEAVALREWHREDENQPWARMMALACWHHIESPLLEAHLTEAEASSLPYLPDFAHELRSGKAELFF
ncbi:MAG TPA: HEAT repeat domain-containing protein, partial [Abditibacterium sp.]